MRGGQKQICVRFFFKTKFKFDKIMGTIFLMKFLKRSEKTNVPVPEKQYDQIMVA